MSNDKQKIQNFHNELMSAVALDYLDPSINGGYDHKRFLMSCRKHLKTPREQSLRNITDVLDLFERKGIMSPGDYEILKDMVKDVNKQIVDLIEETEQNIQRIKEGSESNNENVTKNCCGTQTNASSQDLTDPDETDGATHYNYTFHVGSIRADGGMVAFANTGNGDIKQKKQKFVQ